MPDYNVEMTKIPKLQVGYSDVVFCIKQNEEKLGSLRVSKGHIVWTPVNKQYSYWLTWDDFGKIVVEHGDPRKAAY